MRVLSPVSNACNALICVACVATLVLVANSCEPLTASVEVALSAPAETPVTVRVVVTPATVDPTWTWLAAVLTAL